MGDTCTEKGNYVIKVALDALKKIGCNSFPELFQSINTELNIDFNVEDFMPQRVWVQEFVGQKDACIVYTEINDLELYISSQVLVSAFTKTIMIRENGKWLFDTAIK